MRSPLAGARFVEERNSKIRQRSALLYQSIILKKIYGAAGANHLALFIGACPQVGIFDAPLPVHNLWKNMIVRPGNATASFVSKSLIVKITIIGD